MNHDVSFNNTVFKWRHIESIYQSEKEKIYKLVPKLTESHIYPYKTKKMKVKPAAQVLSHSVSVAINYRKVQELFHILLYVLLNMY